MSIIVFVIFFLLGAYVGYHWRTMRDKLDEIERDYFDDLDKQEHKTGPTLGSYYKVDEVSPKVDPNPKKPKARVIVPKTPQKVDWDAAQELNEENKRFKVGPK